MKISLEDSRQRYAIRAYRHGQVIINDESISDSVIVAPDRLIRNWAPQRLSELEARHLEAVIQMQPAVVLLGTGPTLNFPSPAVIAGLARAGIGVEVMDTGAACRTYNVLVMEGRAVVAALLLE